VAGALREIAYNGMQKYRIDHVAIVGWNRLRWPRAVEDVGETCRDFVRGERRFASGRRVK